MTIKTLEERLKTIEHSIQWIVSELHRISYVMDTNPETYPRDKEAENLALTISEANEVLAVGKSLNIVLDGINK
jgi:hypothetical protein